MKILFINKIDNQGGAASVAWNLANELRKMGHRVRFIVRRKFSDDKDVYELKENPILSIFRKIIRRDFTVVLSNYRDQIMANDIDTGVKNEIIDHPWIEWADIIHCHNLHGNYFKLSNLIYLSGKKPVIWTLHDLWSIADHAAYPFELMGYKNSSKQNSTLSDYQKMLWNNSGYLINKKKQIYSGSKLKLIVPSSWMKNIVKKSILKNKKIRVIHNGIDISIYRRLHTKNSIKKELHIPQNKKIVLFFTYGYKNTNKGWNHAQAIMDHFKNNKSVYFVGIGPGDTNRARNVKYIGQIKDQKLLVKYYNSADLLLFPSLGESFGMVPLEAMACGIPVIAFPVGVIPEVIKHKINGYIAIYDNTADLEKGINYFLNKNTKDMKDIILNNIKIVKKEYTSSKMAKKYLNVYKHAKKEFLLQS